MHIDQIDAFIAAGLKEDVGTGDVTCLACIPSDARNRARLLVKDEGILAGMEIAERIFTTVDPNCHFEKLLDDGADIKYGDLAFIVECQTQALLQAERLVLNTMQRMSGIATLSRQYHDAVADLPVKILDTRKTTPLIRFLEKWAVRIGGCHNYRDGLYDWFMIKDNHTDACGGIQPAIERVDAYQRAHGLNLNVTVEVRNLHELQQVLNTGKVTRIMLDNFQLDAMHTAVKMVNKRFETEASGGVTLETLRNIALTGVDYISVGALTHSAQSLDLSLKVLKE
ncbi:MAG TPA: carboxylating nicotinate-nucleotide diphosphorylase [Haliscomenobacter sp.]|uniref:carboxylating nicotinate-nucleotide diphosphorylase n=1 Tax=Haliscomenobacter sp. TaxID=2717303 RepID=UPI002C5E9482|nr:carboxylating nicotinate-nucleotide diphosphorylase [Haliscomenobacter sp.]HOY15766.1 carboxylating nicotinate-nucleotide diphosphorylase [Haliscomenobacter sp.]